MKTPVILANGTFPSHPIPLAMLRSADPLVCCDGAANKLISAGMTPDVIVGDLDSIAPGYRLRFSGILVEDRNQEINDLTKAVLWCRHHGITDVTILGATGERDDHTLANLSLLAGYNADIKADIISDYGRFCVIRQTSGFSTFPGQQISIFSLTPDTLISSTGLRYVLNNLALRELWQGSLNEATGETFSLRFDSGVLLVYCLHGDAEKNIVFSEVDTHNP